MTVDLVIKSNYEIISILIFCCGLILIFIEQRQYKSQSDSTQQKNNYL